MGLLGSIPLLLVLGGMIFLIWYMPILAKDSKKIIDSTEEINNNLKIITKKNEEIIHLLKNKMDKEADRII